jgi:Ceramidase
MDTTPRGPLYCETGHPWLFMAEPVNTLTNFVIIGMAVAAFLHVRRRTGGAPLDLMVLVALIFATGVGSLFWHMLRSPVWLVFDFMPGLLFLVAFIFLWLRALYGPLAGIGGLVFIIAGSIGAMAFGRGQAGAAVIPRSPLVFAPFFVVLLLIGSGLVILTRRIHGPAAARSAAIVLGFAALAATFRSIDLIACQVVPIGTHFLWHIFLSTAAYRCVVFLTALKPAKAR